MDFRAVASNIVGASFGGDKSFVATGTNLLTPRVEHTATLLPNGKVLVVGGRGQDYDPLSSAELFDPVTKTWSFTSPMSNMRYGHTAILLPNGKVLVGGGQGQDFTPAHSSAELYDPVTGAWTPTGAMATNRYEHTATLLLNGRLLVTGGWSSSSVNPIAELYDPETGSTVAADKEIAKPGHVPAGRGADQPHFVGSGRGIAPNYATGCVVERRVVGEDKQRERTISPHGQIARAVGHVAKNIRSAIGDQLRGR